MAYVGDFAVEGDLSTHKLTLLPAPGDTTPPVTITPHEFTLPSTLNVDSMTTAGTLGVGSTANVSGDLVVGGEVMVENALTVQGWAHFKSDALVDGSLVVKALDVTGINVGGAGVVSVGDVVCQADLNATGPTTRVNDLQISGFVGFFGSEPREKPTISGSWTDGSAGASLVAALAQLGLVVDATSA